MSKLLLNYGAARQTSVLFHDHALGFPSSNHQAEAENSTTSQDHAPYPPTAR
jgi:hypothetical protein